MFAGVGFHSGVRWGDYTRTEVDPSDGMSFWHINQYAQSGDWHTRIGSVKFPGCAQGGPTPTPTATPTPTVSPTATPTPTQTSIIPTVTLTLPLPTDTPTFSPTPTPPPTSTDTPTPCKPPETL